MKPQGIVIHSSGREQPYLKAFVQPDSHKYNNYHYLIGKNEKGMVEIIQTISDSHQI